MAYLNPKLRNCLALLLGVLLALSLTGCTSTSESKQNQAAQDQKLRQQTADATEKAKQESQEAIKQLGATTKTLEHKAQVAAQGAKEGWNSDHPQTLDLNSASEPELESLPGMTRERAEKIIAGRPYRSAQELVTRGIVSRAEYRSIEGSITVGHTDQGRPPRLEEQ